METPAELEVRIAHPTGDLDSPALPFPFTAEQFFAFCESTLFFSFDYIEAVYSNDDHSLDLPALDALARKNKPSAKLVRGLLERKYGLPNGTRSKLSPQDKREIERRVRTGETVASLAKAFGVSRRTIDKCKPTANKPKPLTPLPFAWPAPVKTGKAR